MYTYVDCYTGVGHLECDGGFIKIAVNISINRKDKLGKNEILIWY